MLYLSVSTAVLPPIHVIMESICLHQSLRSISSGAADDAGGHGIWIACRRVHGLTTSFIDVDPHFDFNCFFFLFFLFRPQRILKKINYSSSVWLWFNYAERQPRILALCTEGSVLAHQHTELMVIGFKLTNKLILTSERDKKKKPFILESLKGYPLWTKISRLAQGLCCRTDSIMQINDQITWSNSIFFQIYESNVARK